MSHFHVGIDEAGTGAWAGPATIGLVVVPKGWVAPDKLRDSKKLSPQQREKLNAQILNQVALRRSVLFVSASDIDEYGPRRAVVKSINALLHGLDSLIGERNTYSVIVDGNYVVGRELNGGDGLKRATHNTEYGLPSVASVPKADDLYPCVSAASVLAKVSRDIYMSNLSSKFSYAKHKGYGTPLHREELARYGASHQHRKSYEPVKEFINGNQK